MGMPGSGKSTAGKKLAAKLGLKFIDLDRIIEKKNDKSIAEIFRTEGENTFREQERDCLVEIVRENENCVISLGGGTPCFFDNLKFINSCGISVYIQMPPAALTKRLQQGGADRPLFAGLNENEMLSKVTNLLSERETFYSSANLTVRGTDIDIDELVSSLKKRISSPE